MRQGEIKQAIKHIIIIIITTTTTTTIIITVMHLIFCMKSPEHVPKQVFLIQVVLR
jgi:hypothetical protein